MLVIKLLNSNFLDEYVEHLSRHLPEPGVDGIYSQPFPHGKPIEKESFRKTIETRWDSTPGVDRWEIAWGLFDNNKIVGHLDLVSSGFPALNHRAKLGMGIESAYRNKGYGKQLINVALKWAQSQKFLDYIDLDVFAHNKVALKMYKDFGFKQVGVVQDRLRVENQSIDDIQLCLKLRGTFPPGYHLEICDATRFKEIVGTLSKSIFDEENICAWPSDLQSEVDKIKLDTLNLNYQTQFPFFCILFYKNELAGWSTGRQCNKETFEMENSAILPKFRGKSLYSNMLDEILPLLVSKGFQKIQSHHLLTNNKIIITKLRKKFVITGIQMNDLAGTLVELTYFSNPTRKEVIDFRSGYSKPTEKLKKILKI